MFRIFCLIFCLCLSCNVQAGRMTPDERALVNKGLTLDRAREILAEARRQGKSLKGFSAAQLEEWYTGEHLGVVEGNEQVGEVGQPAFGEGPQERAEQAGNEHDVHVLNDEMPQEYPDGRDLEREDDVVHRPHMPKVGLIERRGRARSLSPARQRGAGAVERGRSPGAGEPYKAVENPREAHQPVDRQAVLEQFDPLHNVHEQVENEHDVYVPNDEMPLEGDLTIQDERRSAASAGKKSDRPNSRKPMRPASRKKVARFRVKKETKLGRAVKSLPVVFHDADGTKTVSKAHSIGEKSMVTIDVDEDKAMKESLDHVFVKSGETAKKLIPSTIRNTQAAKPPFSEKDINSILEVAGNPGTRRLVTGSNGRLHTAARFPLQKNPHSFSFLAAPVQQGVVEGRFFPNRMGQKSAPEVLPPAYDSGLSSPTHSDGSDSEQDRYKAGALKWRRDNEDSKKLTDAASIAVKGLNLLRKVPK